jgi:hypothetical protein
MDGVEILSSTEAIISFNYAFDWLAFWAISLTVSGVVSLIGLLVNAHDWDWEDFITTCFVGVLLGCTFGVMIGVAEAEIVPTEYETHYKVILSDDVSMNKFLEQYKILGQDGKIYIVKEIE